MLLLSLRYMAMPRPICLRLFMQRVWPALALALARAGRSIAARIAIMAMTTSSSIRVKARTRRVRPGRRPKEEWGRFFFIKAAAGVDWLIFAKKAIRMFVQGHSAKVRFDLRGTEIGGSLSLCQHVASEVKACDE